MTQQYLVTDALGSTELVLDIWGQVVNPNAAMSFDAFGQRRQADAWTTPTPWTPSLRLDVDAATRHGYTGHEQADEVGIVHMNGRIYDPLLGRFLQADPFVQAPTNGQSHNRYSYVFNNPMAYTDPTGYFGSKDKEHIYPNITARVLEDAELDRLPYGDGQCVALVRGVFNAPPAAEWKQGRPITIQTKLEPGTAIATFVDGHYQGHASIFVKFAAGRGILVYDQWVGYTADYRVIPWQSNSPAALSNPRSNIASYFSTALWKDPKE